MAKHNTTPINNTKSRIRIAAIDLFRTNGFDNVTIEDICSTVGITKPAFYYHYKSKHNIFDSYYAEVIDQTNNRMAVMFSMAAYWQRLWMILDLFLDHTESAGYDTIAQILKYALDGHNEIFKEYFDSTANAHIALIRKAQARTEIRSELPAEELYELSIKIIWGTLVLWCTGKGEFILKATVRNALEILLDLIPSLRLSAAGD